MSLIVVTMRSPFTQKHFLHHRKSEITQRKGPESLTSYQTSLKYKYVTKTSCHYQGHHHCNHHQSAYDEDTDDKWQDRTHDTIPVKPQRLEQQVNCYSMHISGRKRVVFAIYNIHNMYWLRQQHDSLWQRLNNGVSATSYDTDIDDEIGDMIYKSGETAKARAVAAAANITLYHLIQRLLLK